MRVLTVTTNNLIFTFLDAHTSNTAVPDEHTSNTAVPDEHTSTTFVLDEAISADGDDDSLDSAISADGDDDSVDSTCAMFEATIQEGRALLEEVSDGYPDGDALMGDETAHKKRPKDKIYDENFIDPDL